MFLLCSKLAVIVDGGRLNTHSVFGEFCRGLCQHATRGVPSWRLTCIHSIVSRSPCGHGWVAPDKRHCKQRTNSLFLWIFAKFLPLTYQPRICKDGFISIVTRSLISLWNAICLTGRWSIIGRCFGACQWSSCAEERRPQ